MDTPERMAVIGPSGSGKTTLGRWIERERGLPCVDLDDLHWRRDWTEAPLAEFRAAVETATQQPRWVVVGNYAQVRDLVWARAQLVVWLDLPFLTVLGRTTARGLRQWWTREPICNGNRQTLRDIFFGGDALLPYTLRTYHARRRQWPALLASQQQLTVHRLRSSSEVAAWQHNARSWMRADVV